MRFAEDRRRIGVVLDEVDVAWSTEDAPRVRRLVQDIRRSLIRHMRAENDIIFPTFEAKTGLFNGPTVALRREHRELARRLDELVTELRQPLQSSSFISHFSSLRLLLADHWAREESVLYPSCDQLFEDFQHLAAVKALQTRRRT